MKIINYEWFPEFLYRKILNSFFISHLNNYQKAYFVWVKSTCNHMNWRSINWIWSLLQSFITSFHFNVKNKQSNIIVEPHRDAQIHIVDPKYIKKNTCNFYLNHYKGLLHSGRLTKQNTLSPSWSVNIKILAGEMLLKVSNK